MTHRTTLSIRRAAPTVKLFDGTWVIYRKAGAGFSRKVGGGRMPSFRHQTFDAAQTEAERLAALYPESLFIILQERASVRMKPNLPEPTPRLGMPGEATPPVSPRPSSGPAIIDGLRRAWGSTPNRSPRDD